MSAFDPLRTFRPERFSLEVPHICANVIDDLLKLVDRAGKPRGPIAGEPMKVVFEARQKPSNLLLQVGSGSPRFVVNPCQEASTTRSSPSTKRT